MNSLQRNRNGYKCRKVPRQRILPMQKGFTLIELMFVMAILSILMIIVLPVYHDYQTRAKVSEGFSVVSPAKIAVIDTYLTNAVWPASNSVAGLSAKEEYKTKYVESIEVTADPSGTGSNIWIVYDTNELPMLSGKDNIVLNVQLISGKVQLTCSGSVPEKYRPSSCR